MQPLDLTSDGAGAFDPQITEPGRRCYRAHAQETIGAHNDLDRRLLLRERLYRAS